MHQGGGDLLTSGALGVGRVHGEVLLEVPVGIIQADKRKKGNTSGGSNGISTTKAHKSVAMGKPSTSQIIL